MKTATKLLVAAPLILCLGGCGNLNALSVGVGVLGAGAALWTAHAQSESARVQAEAARTQAYVALATIELNNSQTKYYEEQRLQAVAKREEECSNHVYATNSFSPASCKGIDHTTVCKRVYAAVQTSPSVCVPMLRQAGYRF